MDAVGRFVGFTVEEGIRDIPRSILADGLEQWAELAYVRNT